MDAEAGEEVRVEGDPYAEHTLTWSPDSGSLVAYRVVPGYERMVHYVESAPEDRLQPRHSTITYTKPGDALDVRRPVLLHLDDGNLPAAYQPRLSKGGGRPLHPEVSPG